MRRAALALLVLTLAGCNSESPTIARARLPELVLQDSDLGKGFVSFVNGPQSRADMHPGAREDPARFGRLGGWIARYRRTAVTSAGAVGPLVVESRADLFPSASRAKKDLSAYQSEYESQPPEVGVAAVDPPAVGDGAVAFRFGAGLDHFVVVAWRSANATASILVEGSSVTVADAARLARRQQARIGRATT